MYRPYPSQYDTGQRELPPGDHGSLMSSRYVPRQTVGIADICLLVIALLFVGFAARIFLNMYIGDIVAAEVAKEDKGNITINVIAGNTGESPYETSPGDGDTSEENKTDGGTIHANYTATYQSKFRQGGWYHQSSDENGNTTYSEIEFDSEGPEISIDKRLLSYTDFIVYARDGSTFSVMTDREHESPETTFITCNPAIAIVRDDGAIRFPSEQEAEKMFVNAVDSENISVSQLSDTAIMLYQYIKKEGN